MECYRCLVFLQTSFPVCYFSLWLSLSSLCQLLALFCSRFWRVLLRFVVIIVYYYFTAILYHIWLSFNFALIFLALLVSCFLLLSFFFSFLLLFLLLFSSIFLFLYLFIPFFSLFFMWAYSGFLLGICI